MWFVGTLALILAVSAVGVRFIVQAHLAALVDRDLAVEAQNAGHWWTKFGIERLEEMGRDDQRRRDEGAAESQTGAGGTAGGRLLRSGSPGEGRPGEGHVGGHRMPHHRGHHAGASLIHFSNHQPPAGATPSPDFWRRPRMFNTRGLPMFPGNTDTPWDIRTLKLSLRGMRVFSTVTVQNPAPASLRILSVPLMRGRTVDGVVQIAHPMGELRLLVRRLTGTLLALIPLTMLIAGVGGAFLANRALAPVRTITQAAAQIGAEDLSHRLPEEGGDEFSLLASTFNAMIARLEGAFRGLELAYEQQRRFTADASHELRTPLTTIKANTSLALFGQRTPAEYREALTAADRAADMMNRIVQDLLLLARSDNGQLGLQLRSVRLDDVIERAAAVVRKPGSPPITVEISPGTASVLADAHHLVRLFVNLLENAARHTPPEGRITVRSRADGREVLVTVSDTGEGIPPEHLPHVCERFYRVDAARARAQGGTGLGLAICQSIAQAHLGSLTVHSKVGVGTSVEVRLRRDTLPPDPGANGSHEPPTG